MPTERTPVVGKTIGVEQGATPDAEIAREVRGIPVEERARADSARVVHTKIKAKGTTLMEAATAKSYAKYLTGFPEPELLNAEPYFVIVEARPRSEQHRARGIFSRALGEPGYFVPVAPARAVIPFAEERQAIAATHALEGSPLHADRAVTVIPVTLPQLWLVHDLQNAPAASWWLPLTLGRGLNIDTRLISSRLAPFAFLLQVAEHAAGVRALGAVADLEDGLAWASPHLLHAITLEAATAQDGDEGAGGRADKLIRLVQSRLAATRRELPADTDSESASSSTIDEARELVVALRAQVENLQRAYREEGAFLAEAQGAADRMRDLIDEEKAWLSS